MKTCIVPGCTNPMFGGGYCQRHQYMRDDKHKALRESIRRKEQRKIYQQICKRLDERKSVCYFCGKPIRGKADHHHLLGRTGELYAYEPWIKRVHRECHNQHKFWQTDQLVKLPWWNDYLRRLKKDCPEAYQKELMRMDKAGIDVSAL